MGLTINERILRVAARRPFKRFLYLSDAHWEQQLREINMQSPIPTGPELKAAMTRKSLPEIIGTIYRDEHGGRETECRAVESAATLLMSSNDHGAISDADFESSCGVLWMAFGRS
jgi:hypothetical protein